MQMAALLKIHKAHGRYLHMQQVRNQQRTSCSLARHTAQAHDAVALQLGARFLAGSVHMLRCAMRHVASTAHCGLHVLQRLQEHNTGTGHSRRSAWNS